MKKLRYIIPSSLGVIATAITLSSCNDRVPQEYEKSFDLIKALKDEWKPEYEPLSASRLDPDEMISTLIEESKKDPMFFVNEIRYSILQQAKAWQFETEEPVFNIQISNFWIDQANNTFNFNIAINMHFKTKGDSVIAPDFDLSGEIRNLKSVYTFDSKIVETTETIFPQFINCAPGTFHAHFGSKKEYIKLFINGKYQHGDSTSLETDFDLNNKYIEYRDKQWVDTGVSDTERTNVLNLLWSYLNSKTPYYFQNVSSYKFLSHTGTVTVDKAEEYELEIDFVNTDDTSKMHTLTGTYAINCGLWTEGGSQLTNGIVIKDTDDVYKIKVTTDTSEWTSGNCVLKFYCSDYNKAPYLQAAWQVPISLVVNE